MGKQYTGPWSYSKLRDYEQCPAMFNRRHMQRLKEPESKALEHGSKVHGDIEAWLNGWNQGMSVEMRPMATEFEDLKLCKPVAEQMWAHDKNFEPLEDAFGAEVWVRAKTDAFLLEGPLAYVFDWKTGRPKPMNQDQLRFYGLLTLMREPKVKTVNLELWYVEKAEVVTGEVKRKDLKKLIAEFHSRVKPLYAETRWEETPSLDCRWCPFSKTKNGPCSY